MLRPSPDRHSPTRLVLTTADPLRSPALSILALDPLAAARHSRPRCRNRHRAPRHRTPPRGFLPWRLSDAGPAPCPDLRHGQHPKPFTEPAIARRKAEGLNSTLSGPSLDGAICVGGLIEAVPPDITLNLWSGRAVRSWLLVHVRSHLVRSHLAG